MLTFKVINNATTIINDNFIFDPWIYGNVFYKMWRPFPKPKFDKSKLKNIKYCFISHIHQDHWDMETIKYFKKNTKFFIPKIPYNNVIGNTLKKKNFLNVEYLDLGRWYKISNLFKISVIPPLNSEGAEGGRIELDDDNNIAIDTGLIINHIKDQSYHMLLGDNVPYDFQVYKKLYAHLKIESIFFPHNGYATDYPLCYDKFNYLQKRKLSNLKAIKTERVFINFFKKIKPKIIIPFSAQFRLNNLRDKQFIKVNDETFFHKDYYASRINKITGIDSAILYSEDKLIYKNKKFKNIINSDYKSRRIDSNFKLKRLPFIKKTYNNSLTNLLNIALLKYFERLKKYKINCNYNNLKFVIQISSKNFYIIDFKQKKVFKSKKNLKNNFLKLKINKNNLLSILNKQIHINNCIVSFVFSWERKPNKYYKTFYNSLSFFHL
jgi:hypothetical protein